jgi:ankyrin repeat protein
MRALRSTALRDSGGGTPCHSAARRGQPDVIEALIDVARVDVNARDHRGASCSQVAVFWRNPRVLRRFIEHGADIDCADNMGWSPIAVRSAHRC